MSQVSVSHTKHTIGSPIDLNKASLDSVTKLVKNAIYASCDFKNLVANKSVLIKPNLVRPIPFKLCTTTDPRVIYSVALLTREAGAAKIIVGEKPGWKLSARSVFETVKVGEVLKDLDVEMCYFDEEECLEANIPNARVFSRIRVPRVVLESDIIINLPKMKTHMHTLVSLGIKNLYGLILDDQRLLYHRNDLNYKLVDILRLKAPSLTVTDGIWPMEGQAPHYGEAVKDFNVIVAGTDVVATDAVTCSIMGIEPFEVDTIRIAHMEGLGCGDLKRIRIVGEKPEGVRRYFKRACISSAGVFPNVLCIEAGACLGCLSSIRHSLDRLFHEGKLERLRKITIYTGKPMPESPAIANYEGDLWLVGNCACELLYAQHTGMKRGNIVPGCPPYIADLYNALCTEYKP